MKNLALFFMLFLPLFSFGQVNESFLDGDITDSPTWTGVDQNFMVNGSFQLQSNAASTSVSYLFTPSEAFDDGVWECWVKINYATSSSNYASIYLASDKNDISAGCNAYYVQIGGTSDEVSLYVQEGTKKTKIIDGVDKRVDGNPVELNIKVTRDKVGNLSLYSKLSTESDFVLEGTALNNSIKQSFYFGLLFSNTGTTGSAYYFDNIVVTGNKVQDVTSPVLNSLVIESTNKLRLNFSEVMDANNVIFDVDQAIGLCTTQDWSNDKTSVLLSFSQDFERGKCYQLTISGLTDVAGNVLAETVRGFGIVEPINFGDLVINEIMFENPLNSLEYLEIYNTSNKVVDISGLVFTTRKTDGSLNTGNKVPDKTLLLPQGYLAFCENADSVRNYYQISHEPSIITTNWTALNNESSTVVLCTAGMDTIYDEFTYNAEWHNVLVKDAKGVSLERINPLLPTQSINSWHSAASDVRYGTPGYKNSQYRDIAAATDDEKTFWLDPEAFSPDNDGTNDICFIKYRTDSPGYVATAQILNPNGNKVCSLISNELLGSEGSFTWDGRMANGNNASVGIYVLYIEMFNPSTGKRKQLKLPVVVSSI